MCLSVKSTVRSLVRTMCTLVSSRVACSVGGILTTTGSRLGSWKPFRKTDLHTATPVYRHELLKKCQVVVRVMAMQSMCNTLQYWKGPCTL